MQRKRALWKEIIDFTGAVANSCTFCAHSHRATAQVGLTSTIGKAMKTREQMTCRQKTLRHDPRQAR